MKISIKGNRFFYQENNANEEIEYFLNGEPTLAYDKDFQLFKNNIPLITLKQNQVFQLSEKIKGCDFSKVADLLKEYNIDNLNYQQIQSSSEQEIGLIKSLFLTYQWTEYAFPVIDDDEIDLSSNLFNEFIIDVNNSLGNQLDMYFLPNEVDLQSNITEIELLVSINLLCKVEVSHKGHQYENYFIPLLKPGTSRAYMNRLDSTGKAFKFWNLCLKYRDIKLRKTFNHG